MCGVIEAFDPNHELSKDDIRQMSDAVTSQMVHRGHDGVEFWTAPSGSVAFGHRRLLVTDLTEAGNQPMTSTDGPWTLAYNGEMNNIWIIRELLGEMKFRGHSDTEVLVEAFARCGMEVKTLESTPRLSLLLGIPKKMNSG